MDHNLLCKTIDITLHALPKDIVELIINYVMNRYKYKYTHFVPDLFHNISFNKQLGLIYCNSNKSYRLIDYKTGTYHMSSVIDLEIFESQFVHLSFNTMKHIIYFENDVIICCSGFRVEKYILHNANYYLTSTIRDHNHSACTYNQYIYVYDRTMYGVYRIIIYDFNNLYEIRRSISFNIKETNFQQILVHDNVIHISIKKSPTIYVIRRHDINTLDWIDTIELECNTMTMYQNKIYSYEPKLITVYEISYLQTSPKDAIILNKLYTINVNSFKNSGLNNNISISNDIIMISSEDQIMFYKIE